MEIGKSLGRLDTSCMDKYRTLATENENNVPFTDEEDEKLINLVNELRKEDGSIPWDTIASRMPGRSHVRCCYRWYVIIIFFQNINDINTQN